MPLSTSSIDRSGFAGVVADEGACILVTLPLFPAYDKTVEEDMLRAIFKPYVDDTTCEECLPATVVIIDAIADG
jgi:hypothetical protein